MKAHTMRRLRQLHHYVGVFFAPAILLFALSGAFQTFRWHEAKGYGGTPPRWIVWMASVHKDQSLPHAKAGHGHDHAGPAAAPEARADHDADDDHHHHEDGEGPSPLPLRIFVLLMAVGLIVSATLGVVIALNTRATRRISTIMLIAGAALPLVLLVA